MEAEASKADFGTLVAAMRALHGRMGDALTAQQGPLAQWHEEVR